MWTDFGKPYFHTLIYLYNMYAVTPNQTFTLPIIISTFSLTKLLKINRTNNYSRTIN